MTLGNMVSCLLNEIIATKDSQSDVGLDAASLWSKNTLTRVDRFGYTQNPPTFENIDVKVKFSCLKYDLMIVLSVI